MKYDKNTALCSRWTSASFASHAEDRLRKKLLGSQQQRNPLIIPASEVGQTVFVKLGLGVYKIIKVVRPENAMFNVKFRFV